MPVFVSSHFDAGAIEVQSLDDPQDIRLGIRADSHADFRQWFFFRLHGTRDVTCRIVFTNAGECTYPAGWKRYAAVASYDRQRWFRVPTAYDGKEMVVTHTPERDSVYYAYFEPYSWQRHLDLLGKVQESDRVRVSRLGGSVEERDVDLVTVGDAGSGKSPVWIIARQHPGETMAEWFVEGLLERLIDPADATANALLRRAVFHVVPNMNPDGSVRGNLRTNAAGANLNREWLDPSREKSPEVFVVREAMQRFGIAAFLDVHGDEALPYVFVDGCERLASYRPEDAARERTFIEAFRAASADFQTEHGYPSNKDTKVNLSLASKWVGHHFACLSLTLEMPFKDNANLPDQLTGWDGARSRRLGGDVLPAFRALLEAL